MSPWRSLPDLDAEHAEILARLTVFRDRTLERRAVNVLRESLMSIHDALTAHFRVEQDVMRTFRYAGLWEHADEHLIIWHAFLRLMDACEGMNFAPNCGELVYKTMTELLKRHIEKHDRPFILFATEKTKKRS